MERNIEGCQAGEAISECGAARIGFNWSVTHQDKRNIKILLDFSDPRKVSTSIDGQDQINFKIIEPEFFVSAESGKPIKYDSNKPPPVINYLVPPQNTVTEEMKEIFDTTSERM